MISRLLGTLIGQGDDGTITMDVHGVGYEVSVPLGMMGRVKREPDGTVLLHIHTSMREDGIFLYGFASQEERSVFRTLISISNVGPKIALAILGALSVSELANTIARQELHRLTSISGVGRKTAERLLLELKDKLSHVNLVHEPLPAMPAPKPVSLGGKAELLRSALSNMGFRPQEVDRAMESLKARIPNAELADLVREALVALRQSKT